MSRVVIVCLFMFSVACGAAPATEEPLGGASQAPSATEEPIGGASGQVMPAEGSCEGYSEGDACITAENLAQCEQMSAQCPGEMQVMESCPLQFTCPD